MAEAAFSENGKYYSAITQDGRLRIWDTETNILKQEYTPDLHLKAPPSCLQWINVIHSATPQQKSGRKNSISSGEETQCIALGTTSGKILIYSISQAKVETVLAVTKNNDAHQSKITALDWGKKYGLYSCNKENRVFEWDLQSGSVRNKYNVFVQSNTKQGNNVSAIKIVPHKLNTQAQFLVTATWQIRLWRLHNGEAAVIKNFGHNTGQTALLRTACLNDVCWLIEGSQNERLLSFWDVTITEDSIPQQNGDDPPSKRQRKKSTNKAPTTTTPTYNFVLEDAPRIVDVALREEDGVRLSLAAATRSGVVHYYSHMLNGSSTKPIKPSVTVQVTTAAAVPLPLHCCRLQTDGDVTLGYAREPALVFEKVTPDLKTKTQVLIRGDTKESKKSKLTNDINKVKAVSSKDVAYVEPMGGVSTVSRKRVTPGAQIEVPMEARLENLSLDIKSRSQTAVGENLTKLLMQGLHSKDRGIILTVLQKDNPKVALSTVSGLPADYVHLLLEQLAEMAASRTSQCSCVCTWAGAVLRAHAALLLAAAASRPSLQLAHLMAVFTHRRSLLCQLLNLKGRLDLTIKQRDTTQHTTEDQQAVLQYNDTSSDEEMEVEQYQSDSAQSWNESDEGPDGSDADTGHSDAD